MSSLRGVSRIPSTLDSRDVQSALDISTSTNEENAKATGVKFLLILLAVRDKDGKIIGYTDLDIILSPIGKDFKRLYAINHKGRR